MFSFEDELDRQVLLQRFEAEMASGELGYYSWAALETLFLEYMDMEDEEMAERVIHHAQFLYEGHPRLHLLYSYYALRKGKLIEAYAHIQKVFQFDIPDQAVYEQYIEVLVRLGRLEEAYWLLEAYEEAYPEAGREIWRYGTELFRERGDWVGVRRAAKKGLRKALPQEVYFWWQLVRSYERMASLSEGIQDFWAAVWAEPLEYRWWLGLAYLYERKFAYPQALQALAEAQKLLSLEAAAPENWWALYYYIQARVYEGLGQWEAAFQAYLWVRHYRPQVVSALRGIIAYYQRQERWSEAEPHLRQAIRLAGDRPSVQALAAEHLWGRGDWSLAAQFYESLLGHGSYAEKAMERLLLHYADQSHHKSLRRILGKAAKLFQRRPELWLRWSMQAHARQEFLLAWHIADWAMRTIEKPYLSAGLCFWHAGLAWRLGHRRRALYSLEQGLLREAAQLPYLQKALPDGEIPLPFQHLLRRYGQFR